MSQRDSTYERKPRDFYATPAWVTAAALPHLPLRLELEAGAIWEPACGNGDMVRVLEQAGFTVVASDITDGDDFLFMMGIIPPVKAIITNPPYNLAHEFCEHALRLTKRTHGVVAMLLGSDFDYAKSRASLFRDCPQFAKKIALTKRIVWFVEDNGKPKASPSENHAWYVWDWKHEGPPTIGYAP